MEKTQTNYMTKKRFALYVILSGLMGSIGGIIVLLITNKEKFNSVKEASLAQMCLIEAYFHSLPKKVTIDHFMVSESYIGDFYAEFESLFTKKYPTGKFFVLLGGTAFFIDRNNYKSRKVYAFNLSLYHEDRRYVVSETKTVFLPLPDYSVKQNTRYKLNREYSNTTKCLLSSALNFKSEFHVEQSEQRMIIDEIRDNSDTLRSDLFVSLDNGLYKSTLRLYKVTNADDLNTEKYTELFRECSFLVKRGIPKMYADRILSMCFSTENGAGLEINKERCSEKLIDSMLYCLYLDVFFGRRNTVRFFEEKNHANMSFLCVKTYFSILKFYFVELSSFILNMEGVATGSCFVAYRDSFGALKNMRCHLYELADCLLGVRPLLALFDSDENFLAA